MNNIRIMVVEDDADYRYLILRELENHGDMALVAACAAGEQACAQAREKKPDIVLMDLNLSGGGLDGVDAARRIRIETDARVIILTSYDDPDTVIRASTRSFASAYVLKSQFPLLVPTIRETAAGPTPQSHLICSALLSALTPAEYSVFEYMLGREMTLRSSHKTIANQQTGVLRKLGLTSRRELCHVFAAYFPGPSAPHR